MGRQRRETTFRRGAVALLLITTGVVYSWKISHNGWANAYYAAAVQSATLDNRAWLFGSFDPENFITVDKPPAALWFMGLSGRIFGFSSSSMLLPQVGLAVAIVALLYASVRRAVLGLEGPLNRSPHHNNSIHSREKNAIAARSSILTGSFVATTSGVLAGLLFALTPASAVTFRYNAPDALLVFFMVLSGYLVLRAIQAETISGASWWLIASGSLLGWAFLTKMLEGFLVVPGCVLAYLLAGRGSLWVRLASLCGAACAFVITAGWWILLMEWTPPSRRPHIGGSPSNSVVDLIVGYNGLQRVVGGFKRHVWEIPSAASPHHDLASTINYDPGVSRLFTGDLAVQGGWWLLLALIAVPTGLWWSRKTPRTDVVRASLCIWGGWLVTGFVLFSTMQHAIHSYYAVALAPPLVATLAITMGQWWKQRDIRGAFTPNASRWWACLNVISGVCAYGIVCHSLGGARTFALGIMLVSVLSAALLVYARARAPWLYAAAVLGVLSTCAGPAYCVVATISTPQSGSSPRAAPLLSPPHPPARPSLQITPELIDVLHRAGSRWSAAIERSTSAAHLQLATGTAVIAIGGFTGDDPAPSLQEFTALVSQGEVRYFLESVATAEQEEKDAEQRKACLLSNPSTPTVCKPGNATVGPEIQQWVHHHSATPRTIGNVRLYDLLRRP